jgi:DNA-binding NarL/FixJ family response regulator
MSMALRILIADDHAVVADGIRHLLATQSDFEVIGLAPDGGEAVRMAGALRPDVTLMDIVMPHLNGIEAARQILQDNPDARVVMLSMYSDSERVYQALQAGARGYVLKRDLPIELCDAIRQVGGGGRYLSPGVTDTVVTDYLHDKRVPDPLQALSGRERHVLQMLVEGKTAAAVARKLELSPRTVETYKARVMRKLGLADLPALVKFAVRHGITSLE